MTTTRDKLETQFSAGELDDEYAEFIMENCGGERIICNGDTLLEAMEDGYLADSFLDMMENRE